MEDRKSRGIGIGTARVALGATRESNGNESTTVAAGAANNKTDSAGNLSLLAAFVS